MGLLFMVRLSAGSSHGNFVHADFPVLVLEGLSTAVRATMEIHQLNYSILSLEVPSSQIELGQRAGQRVVDKPTAAHHADMVP